MRIKNRIATMQPDYLLKIVRRPKGWQPRQLHDIPPASEVLSVDHVASYQEARDDLLRCNRLSLEERLDRWAILESSGGDL